MDGGAFISGAEGANGGEAGGSTEGGGADAGVSGWEGGETGGGVDGVSAGSGELPEGSKMDASGSSGRSSERFSNPGPRSSDGKGPKAGPDGWTGGAWAGVSGPAGSANRVRFWDPSSVENMGNV